MRRVLRRGLQRLYDHLLDLSITYRPWPARTPLIKQPIEAILSEPGAPLTHRRVIKQKLLGDLGVLQSLSSSQHDP
jgi:hypothetical protein